MAKRAAGAVIGVVFGVVLSWSGLSSPTVLRQGLLFGNAYLYLLFASAVLVSFVGVRALRALRLRAPLTGERVSWRPEAPQRRHVAGALLFGIGWGLADACPGPIATQIGQGIPWGTLTMAGVVLGIRMALKRRQSSAERSRAPAEPEPAPNPA